MKPVLFEKDNTNYDHNGIAVLHDALSCMVYEEHNGIFDLELEYPIDGEWASFILEDRQILAKPNDVDDPHAFRIYEVDKDLEEGIVYVKATSITDDLRGNLIPYVSVTDSTAQQTLTAIKNGLIEETRFDFISDIDIRSAAEWTRINPLQAIAGTGGSFVDIWGGDIKRTNNALYVYSRRGTDHVTVIRPGKNVDGFKMVASTKGIVTKILPCYTYTPESLPVYHMVDDGSGNMVKQQDYDDQNEYADVRPEPVTVLGTVVTSPDAHKYPVNQYIPVDYSRDEYINETVELFIELKRLEAEISETVIDVSGFDQELQDFVLELLNEQAATYFIMNEGIDKVSVQFKADMIQLSDSDEWELFKNLETIQVSDTVDVYVKKFDVDVEVKINSITYDSIGERVTSIIAGTTRNTLSQSITKPYEDAVKELEDYIDGMENGVYNTISRTANGQNKRFSGYTEPPASVSSEGDLWYKDIGEGKVELWIYRGGVWAPLISAAVSEAIEQAISNASDAAATADGKAQGIIDNVQGLVLEDGITTLGDLIASKVSSDDYSTLFFQQSKAIGLVWTNNGVDEAIIMINEDGIPYIKGEHIILNGDTIVDGTFTVTDTMLAEDAVIKSLTATGIDAESIRVINLDASSIVGGDLEVTESFRITHNGVPVLEVDAVTGQIKITAPNLATKTDLENIELTPGPTGTGIESVTEYYLATSLSTGVTTGTVGFTTTIQTITSTNKYLWNYEKTTYTDGSTRTTSPVIIGVWGNTGSAGKGISSITEYYLATSASTGVTTSTSGWTTSMQTTTDTNKHLWNYEVITYTDSTTTTIAPVIIGTHGAKGDTGSTGKGISGVTEYYLASTSNSGVTTATSGWSTTVPTITSTNKYLWNYEKTTYTDSLSVNSTPVVLGVYGDTGSAGKGISSITEYYLASSANTGVTTATAGWTTTVQTTDATKKYLWNYEVITYTDATTTTINPVIIGTHGSTGSAGVSVTSIVEEYYRSSSNTAQSGGSWSTTVPAWLDGTYMWTRTKTTFSDATTSTTSPVCVSGTKGADGTTTYTWVKYADDDQGAGLSDTPAGKRYIGISVNRTSSTESSTATDYTWSPLYDNVSVGGRNIMGDSFLKRFTDYNFTDMVRTDAESPTSTNALKFTYTDATLAGTYLAGIHSSTDRSMVYEQGKDYTLSFKARGNVTNFNYTYMMRLSAEGGNSGFNSLTVALSETDWTTVVMHKNAPWTTSTGYLLIGSRDVGTAVNEKWFEIKEVMMEQGNINTPFTASPEDIQEILDGKSSNSDLEALAGIVSSVSAVANAAAGMGEFQAMQAAFDERVAQDIEDKEALATSLATMDGRITLAHTIAGDAKLVTEFVNTVITEAEEGIYISNGASNTGILIASDRISFMDNDIEVAYISNQTMQINHGIFVESATIADFKFEKIPGTTIMAIQWVGA